MKKDHRMKKLMSIVTVFATVAFLASCAEETGGTTGSTGTSPSSTTMAGATAGTTMSGTTMGGTTMSGGTTGGTTMAGTTSGGTTMSTTTSGTTSGATSGGSITSLQSIVSETDKQSLAGRRVELKDVDVRSSVGDSGFLVGSSGADQVFVVPGGSADVQQGQTANIEGTLEEIPGLSEAQQKFGLSETEAALLQSQVVYLDAEQIQ